MTSKHLFFKAMREDLRHRTWMIVLSSLGSFLVLPVAWLMYTGRRGALDYLSVNAKSYDNMLNIFFGRWLVIMGGILAIAGALIVGLAGFRYVFHKNMVDTWHSLPIKRRTLYGVCWLNGLLVWLVPFLAGLLVTLVLAVFSLPETDSRTKGWLLQCMFSEAANTFVVLLIVFLLVYHLVLTAVMVSGNTLNTLVSMMILGFGAASVYGLCVSFFQVYMDSFYSSSLHSEPVFYVSPLLGAGYFLYQRCMLPGNELLKPVLIHFGVMALLGIVAWELYRRRASELAEQGIRNKIFSTGFRAVIGVTAGMGGWLFFALLTNEPGWGVFGTLFAGILAFGVMDVIFSMDFKAFFSHKLQMAAVAAATLAVSICFYKDAFGFDSYLPDPEDIAEIAVYDSELSNRELYYTSDRTGSRTSRLMLENIHIQDTDAAYAYLSRMTGRDGGAAASEVSSAYSGGTGVRYTRYLATKVTLKNGRTYYRNYPVTDADMDVLWPLLVSREYLEQTYMVDTELAADFTALLGRGGQFLRIDELSTESIRELIEAYNTDLAENPESVLGNGGVLLASLELDRTGGAVITDGSEQPTVYQVHMAVYDSMEHTVACLRQLGYGEWVQKQDPETIREIRLPIYHLPEGYISADDIIQVARDYYGVYAAPQDYQPGWSGEMGAAMPEISDYDFYYPYYNTDQIYLSVTEPEEIRELMKYLHYETPYFWTNVLSPGFATVGADVAGQEDSCRLYIRRGELPEKYILRFGQLDQYLTEQ